MKNPVDEPPDPAALHYFIDRCLGDHVLPLALRSAGMGVTTMREAGYPHDVEDRVWIPEVAARGWVILTKDRNIRRDSLELRVMLQAKARYFTIGRASYRADDMAKIILRHRRGIEELCQSQNPPIIVQLNRGELLLRQEDGSLKTIRHRRLR